MRLPVGDRGAGRRRSGAAVRDRDAGREEGLPAAGRFGPGSGPLSAVRWVGKGDGLKPSDPRAAAVGRTTGAADPRPQTQGRRP